MSDLHSVDSSPPNSWAGFSAVAVIVIFGCLAAFDTSLRQSRAVAKAAASETQPVVADVVGGDAHAVDPPSQADGADQVILPLYVNETGAHRPADSDRSSPGPDAVGLFESH